MSVLFFSVTYSFRLVHFLPFFSLFFCTFFKMVLKCRLFVALQNLFSFFYGDRAPDFWLQTWPSRLETTLSSFPCSERAHLRESSGQRDLSRKNSHVTTSGNHASETAWVPFAFFPLHLFLHPTAWDRDISTFIFEVESMHSGTSAVISMWSYILYTKILYIMPYQP